MLRQIGLNIAHYRKLRRMSQKELSEVVGISRGFLGHIEAPNISVSFSVPTILDISRALGIEAKELFAFKDTTETAPLR